MAERKRFAPRPPIRPDRIRPIERGFAFVPNRFLHEGFFASLNHIERSLYFFLILAGDRNGISFYSYDRICSMLELTLDDYITARNALIEKDLIAFDGEHFQVLELPERPICTPRTSLITKDDLERDDPATIRQVLRNALRES